MALVNRPIPSLIGGVSQQPASLRHSSQVDAMENCVPSVAVGVRKRTGTSHVARLSPVQKREAFAHAINRGTTGTSERYFVVADQGDLKVYNWRGEEQVVAFPNGKTYLSTFPNGSLARDIFAAVTVADYTFFVNKTYPVTMNAAPAIVDSGKTYCVIKAGVANIIYYVQLGGNSYSYATNTTDYRTPEIAEGLKVAINAGGLFTAVRTENLLVITKNAGGSAYTFSYADGYGDQAGFMFRDTVNRYEELPRKFVDDGQVFKIKGEPNGDGTNGSWYVRWSRVDVNKDGVWIETVAPGVATTLTPSTMPHELVRLSDATWVFRERTWTDRVVGDDLSNPVPSFVGGTINDVTFHRNRLGFLSDENIALSQAGKFFNFFATTARTVVDSDPIDVSASTNKVTILRHAITFNKALMLFSEKMQFVFGSEGTTLKPGSAKLDPATTFETSANCKPVALGTNVYFPVPRGQYTGIREYYVDVNSISNDAADVTAHVPSYIPTGVFKMSTAPTEDMVFALSSERNVAYVYNSFWDGEKKAQSAWHKWVFPADEAIVSMDVFGSTLAMLINRADGLYLDMMELEERPYSPTDYTLCLDRWIGHNGGVYDPLAGTTTWALPYPDTGDFTVVIVSMAGQVGQGLQATRPASNSVSVRGNYAGQLAVIGRKYGARVQLSELFNRDGKDDAIVAGKLQLRDISVAFDRTGYFSVTVTPQARTPYVYSFPNRPLGLAGFIVGKQLISSGKQRFPVQSKSDQVTIELKNDSHLPCVFQALEWTGVFAMQARRM
jgi:hypothetical protein